MSALTRYFFLPVYSPRSAWSIAGWWERRRLTYNLAVGAAGLLSLTAITVASALPPHPRLVSTPLGLVGVVLYGVMANLFYSAGPVVDLWIRRRWGDDYAAVGPTLFRYGFVFSVGLTLLPVPLAFLGWIARVVQALI